ncbi:hypothetical protein CEUSTIGMA_g13184.t1 [Chlamydomonas eustigma]|uniref:Uncharacterized protein n=1 Tax=Chlamydomonas eustigma TaxID=1157962 RepID=A0A250XS49_9CHLO|nr:hypothetical protein CEUSTIGMA_g13184.t1 [Chlamydomonas eustigma]|eukprot:GAX85769.1 hypothetical protein CEUSTIGMA_g13184.t1 [Chlamydomonas eustigma]
MPHKHLHPIDGSSCESGSRKSEGTDLDQCEWSSLVSWHYSQWQQAEANRAVQVPNADGVVNDGELHGEDEAEVHGEDEAEVHGEDEAEVHGEDEAELHGEDEAELLGEDEDELHGEDEAELHGEDEAELHGEEVILESS